MLATGRSAPRFDTRLLPKEHGAYAQLGFPILSGLLVGGFTWPGAGLALAAVLAFVAVEPIEVLIGTRGARAQETLASQARVQLIALAVLAAIMAALALWAMPAAVRALAAAPAALGLVLLPLVFARRLKSLMGELLAVAAFAALHLPIAAAAGATGARLWGPTVVWFAAFVAATFAVHALKARHKGRAPGLVAAAVAATGATVMLAVAVGLGLGESAGVPRVLGWAALAPAAAALSAATRPVHPRHLKRVGWALVVANLVALAGLALL